MHFSFFRKSYFLILLAGLTLPVMVSGDPANAPAWWRQSDAAGLSVIDPNVTESNPKGPANIGQAKWMAKRALDALHSIDAALADGILQKLTVPQPNPADPQGPPLQKILDLELPNPLPSDWPQTQRAPLLVGQLKAIAAPFYDALHAAAPDWLDHASTNEAEQGQLQLNGTKDPNLDAGHLDFYYPWTYSSSDDQNKAIATIGQLKAVFSLRFDTDTDGDGLSDYAEMSMSHTNPTSRDSDGDGVSDWDEIKVNSTNPLSAGDADGDGIPDDFEIHLAKQLLEFQPDPATWSSWYAGLITGNLDATHDYTGDGLSAAELSSLFAQSLVRSGNPNAEYQIQPQYRFNKLTNAYYRPPAGTFPGETYGQYVEGGISGTDNITLVTGLTHLTDLSPAYLKDHITGPSWSPIVSNDFVEWSPFELYYYSHSVAGFQTTEDPPYTLFSGFNKQVRMRVMATHLNHEPFTQQVIKLTSKRDYRLDGLDLGDAISTEPLTISIPKGRFITDWINLEPPVVEGRATVVSLLPVEVAVDADRDGEITFDGKDKTTAEKPFRFWINDDRDIGHTVDSIAHPPGDWEEDDVNSDEQANPDCDVPGLKFRRDLEDLTRVWIDFAGISGVFPASDTTVALKVRIDADSGTPKVNLFQPVESDGGREFLKDEATGYNQLQGIYGQELCKVTGSGSVEVPRRAWESLPSDKVVHLLFEGAKEGDGKLIFELWKDGAKVCDLPPVILRLRKANDFYETWTVGDVTSPEITDDNNNYSVWPASSASMQPNTGRDLTTPEKPEEKDYIMFVHGWNMTPDDKTQFADTMFKRLWHQGFKGRFGAYRWPTFFTPNVEVNNFNGSEERAWSSAAPLAALLQNRSTIFNVGGSSRVRVFGHSMGNIVCSEALRILGPSSTAVHTYVSGQAALAAHCWDATNPRWMPYGVPFFVTTANIYRGYWQPAAGADAPHKWEASGRPSYMHSSYMPSGVKYVNHYNIDDWALDSWELNQKLKPALGYNYGWVPGTALGSEHRFYKNVLSPTTLVCPTDRFQIFSWAAQARSFATGAEPATRGVFSVFVNLRAAPYSFDDKHKGHSAQFRSTIQKRWVYWRKFLVDCEVPYNP
jgi:hypothetical protein